MKTKTDIDRTRLLDELAAKAMSAILTGLWSDPGMMDEASKLASNQKVSLALFVSEQSYVMANAMRITKHKMNNDSE